MNSVRFSVLLAGLSVIGWPADTFNVVEDGLAAAVALPTANGAGLRYVYFEVSEGSVRGNPPPWWPSGPSSILTLSDCVYSDYDGSQYRTATCVDGFGAMPTVQAFAKRGKQMDFNADLGAVPGVTLRKFAVNLLTYAMTPLTPPATYPVRVSWRAAGLNSVARSGVTRMTYPTGRLTQAGTTLSETADVSGILGEEVVSGAVGLLRQNQNVSVLVER